MIISKLSYDNLNIILLYTLNKSSDFLKLFDLIFTLNKYQFTKHIVYSFKHSSNKFKKKYSVFLIDYWCLIPQIYQHILIQNIKNRVFVKELLYLSIKYDDIKLFNSIIEHNNFIINDKIIIYIQKKNALDIYFNSIYTRSDAIIPFSYNFTKIDNAYNNLIKSGHTKITYSQIFDLFYKHYNEYFIYTGNVEVLPIYYKNIVEKKNIYDLDKWPQWILSNVNYTFRNVFKVYLKSVNIWNDIHTYLVKKNNLEYLYEYFNEDGSSDTINNNLFKNIQNDIMLDIMHKITCNKLIIKDLFLNKWVLYKLYKIPEYSKIIYNYLKSHISDMLINEIKILLQEFLSNDLKLDFWYKMTKSQHSIKSKKHIYNTYIKTLAPIMHKPLSKKLNTIINPFELLIH